MKDERGDVQIGQKQKDGSVGLLRFLPDPDGSGLHWGEATGEITTIKNLRSLGTREKVYDGKCYDTGEFFSHVGEMLYELVQEAPRETTLVVSVDWENSCGTKTFSQRLVVEYFAPE